MKMIRLRTTGIVVGCVVVWALVWALISCRFSGSDGRMKSSRTVVPKSFRAFVRSLPSDDPLAGNFLASAKADRAFPDIQSWRELRQFIRIEQARFSSPQCPREMFGVGIATQFGRHQPTSTQGARAKRQHPKSAARSGTGFPNWNLSE